MLTIKLNGKTLSAFNGQKETDINIDLGTLTIQKNGETIGTYVGFSLGSSVFQKILYGVKFSAGNSTIFMSETKNLNINLTDHEILTAYNGFKYSSFNFPNSTAYMYIEVQIESGNIADNFSITVGGTGWIKSGSTWNRCVPYKLDSGKPCVMYTNIGGIWNRLYN